MICLLSHNYGLIQTPIKFVFCKLSGRSTCKVYGYVWRILRYADLHNTQRKLQRHLPVRVD